MSGTEWWSLALKVTILVFGGWYFEHKLNVIESKLDTLLKR